MSKKLSESNFDIYRNINESAVKANALQNVLPFTTQKYIEQWSDDINRDSARAAALMAINSVCTEHLNMIISPKIIVK